MCSLKSWGILDLEDDLPEIMVYGNYKQLTRIIYQFVEEFTYHPTQIGNNSADNTIMKNMLKWERQLKGSIATKKAEMAHSSLII